MVIYMIRLQENPQSIVTSISAHSRSCLIGGWWNKDGILFLDVVLTIHGRESAMVAGRMNGEEEIYHPYSNRSIKVGTPQTDLH